MLIASLAVTANGCLVVHRVAELRQVDHLLVGDQHDIAAASAVPPIGAALGRMRLTTEREATVAPASRLDVDLGPIGK